MRSTTQKWLSHFGQILRNEPFFSSQWEDCMARFITGPWLQSDTLQKACNIPFVELEKMYEEAYHFYQEDNFLESEELFRWLVIFDPFVEKYWFGFSASLQMLARYEEALKGYAIMAQLDEKSPYPYYYSSSCLEKLNRHEESKQALHFAYKQASSNQI